MLGAAYVLLGLLYLAGQPWRLMRVLGPTLKQGRSTGGAATLGLVFGLNIPACAAPLLAAVFAASLGTASLAQGFWVMALFGLALSLPLMAAVLWGRARGWLDRLSGLSSRMPFWTGVVFVSLGLWSIYFGARDGHGPEPKRGRMRRTWRMAPALPVVIALAVGACDLRERPGGMDAGGPVVPSVLGYAEGEEILFMHTEASDPEIADTLTAMMQSPVLIVPTLAQVPEAALANVYVFANGIQPRGNRGPLEYQPDVFDAPAGTPAYRPLRAANLVTWASPDEARLLTSAAEIQQAEAAGEVTIERPGVVVNMPFLTWPGGGER